MRLGSEVTIIYRRERKDMPAIPEETEAAEAEGAEMVFLATPHRIIGSATAACRRSRVVKTKLGEFDSSGRRRPVPTDEVVRLDCDTVILAVGETVDLDFVKASGLKIKESGTIEVDRYTLETSRNKFYAGGDVITGASNVSNAMGYGKEGCPQHRRPFDGRAPVRQADSRVRLRPVATSLSERQRKASCHRTSCRGAREDIR